jgi:hypothetical protein
VDPLVAEVQGGSEFAQRRAAQMQAAYRAVKLCSGNLGSVFGLDEPFLRLPRSGEQILVHSV